MIIEDMIEWFSRIGLAGFGVVFAIIGVVICLIAAAVVIGIMRTKTFWQAIFLISPTVIFLTILIGAGLQQPFLSSLWRDHCVIIIFLLCVCGCAFPYIARDDEVNRRF